MLEVLNLEQFARGIERWAEKTEKLVEEVARGLAAEAFHRVVQESPQYSGDFAGGWKYAINRVDISFDSLALPFRGAGEPRISGDKEAINWAIAQNKWKDNDFKLGDTVYLSNSAEHDEPYAQLIEDGSIKFRPGNRGGTVENVLTAIGSQYGFINGQQARYLRKRRL